MKVKIRTWQQLEYLPRWIWILPITALAFATRLYQLDGQSLWFDEIFTVAMARLPWYQGMVSVLGHGVQLTPVWHWIIKGWLPVGDSDWLVRFPTVLFGILAIPLIFKLGQLYFSEEVGLLAAFIVAINPYQVWYGQELRVYTLLLLTAAGAMYAFSDMIRTQGRKGVWLLAFFNFLGLPAHYFMFLVSIVQFLYLIITFRRTYSLLRVWIVTQSIGAFPLVLWWLFLIYQWRITIGTAWIPAPSWYTPLLTLWNFSFTYTGDFSPLVLVGLGIVLIGLVLGLIRAWDRFERGLLLTLWLLAPPVIVIIMSLGRVSFYVDRYLIIITPILTLLVASGLMSIRHWAIRWGMILILITITGLRLGEVYFDREDFSKEDWRMLARTLDAQGQPGQRVITCTDGHWLSFEYYNRHQNLEPDKVIFAAQVKDLAPSERGAWVIEMHEALSAHYLGKSQPPVLDRGKLSSEVATWEAKNLMKVIIVSGISAYQYQSTDPQFLAEVVEWRCGE
jgi:mannosyltransferase